MSRVRCVSFRKILQRALGRESLPWLLFLLINKISRVKSYIYLSGVTSRKMGNTWESDEKMHAPLKHTLAQLQRAKRVTRCKYDQRYCVPPCIWGYKASLYNNCADVSTRARANETLFHFDSTTFQFCQAKITPFGNRGYKHRFYISILLVHHVLSAILPGFIEMNHFLLVYAFYREYLI